jgi:diamine N-acetyltransferase
MPWPSPSLRSPTRTGRLLTSYTVGDGGPAGFYERLGFVPTGEFDENGEVILCLPLSRASAGELG